MEEVLRPSDDRALLGRVALRAPQTPKLRARITPRARIDARVRDEMWRLFASYYADVTRERFERDLAEKQYVLLGVDAADGSVKGFSTVAVYSRRHANRNVLVVFSGDTVLDRPYWGQTALQLAFTRLLLRLKLANPFTPVYWFLISKGYKTYLLLARNFLEYYPHATRPTPPRVATLVERLATERFGAAFRPEHGVLRFGAPQGRLKAGVAPVHRDLLADPDVALFVAKNPGHARGDELCCLGVVGLAQIAHQARRFIARALSAKPSKSAAARSAG